MLLFRKLFVLYSRNLLFRVDESGPSNAGGKKGELDIDLDADYFGTAPSKQSVPEPVKEAPKPVVVEAPKPTPPKPVAQPVAQPKVFTYSKPKTYHKSYAAARK